MIAIAHTFHVKLLPQIRSLRLGACDNHGDRGPHSGIDMTHPCFELSCAIIHFSALKSNLLKSHQ
jgi:hypothetical protein